MNIFDFLKAYRIGLMAPADEGGSAGGAGTAGAGEAGAAGGDTGGGDAPAAGDTANPAADQGAAPDAGKPDGAAGDDQGGDDKGGESPDDASGGDEISAENFALTAPEGMENFQGDFDAFSSEASEWMQANPEATPAQALKWAADRQAAAMTAQNTELAEGFARQIETWENEARADKEIGGDGFDANVALAQKAIDAFGDDTLKTVLKDSGLGSHPAVIRFAMKAGKSVADAPVIKTNEGGARKSLAESLYGKKE